jgi:hypothetical protein
VSGDASLERPAGAAVLRELHGVVDLAPDRAYAELAARLDPHGESAFLTDDARRLIVLQGGYWYRGEYRIDADGHGSVVHYTIVNVAPGSKLLGALTGRGAVRAAPAEFAGLLRSLAPGSDGQGST